MRKTRKRSEHYVNNKEFLAAIIAYKDQIALAEARGEAKPVIPRYIGECFLKIANHLSFKPNFVNYMFKDDMVCDGIENCVQYINNFNPEKSSNPFAYFTQIIHYAFLRRIQKEKKQLEIKSKILERSGYDEVFSVDGEISGSSSDYNQIKDSVNYNTNGGILPMLRNDGILTPSETEDGSFSVDENWEEIGFPNQRVAIATQVNDIIGSELPVGEKDALLEDLFANVPNPDNLTLEEFLV